MTNVVNVTIQVDGAPGDPSAPEGNYVFTPSGVMWPDTSSNPIVPMVVHGQMIANPTANPPNCLATVELVASDNFAASVLTWDVIINVRGMPTINVPNVPVNFSNGANQNIWTILQAAGWSPLSEP